jgi:hypothetical protein
MELITTKYIELLEYEKTAPFTIVLEYKEHALHKYTAYIKPNKGFVIIKIYCSKLRRGIWPPARSYGDTGNVALRLLAIKLSETKLSYRESPIGFIKWLKTKYTVITIPPLQHTRG